jgi:hypothetical protein
LEAFAQAELKINNPEQLTTIADQIADAGLQLGEVADGRNWAQLDALLPAPSEYK